MRARRRMHRRWRRARSRVQTATDRIYAYIQTTIAGGLARFEHKPRSALDAWRAASIFVRATNPGEAAILDAAVRFVETGEPQVIPHGTVTFADIETGVIRFTANVPMESIAFTLTVGPEST